MHAAGGLVKSNIGISSAIPQASYGLKLNTKAPMMSLSFGNKIAAPETSSFRKIKNYFLNGSMRSSNISMIEPANYM